MLRCSVKTCLSLAVACLLLSGCEHAKDPLPPLPSPAPSDSTTIFSNQAPRHALVIGNADYNKGDRLNNPANDATDVARALQELGYQVTLHTDLDLSEMDRAIDTFGKSLPEDGIGIFYYAGHGVQVDGENYLVPVDAQLKEERHARRQAFALTDVVAAMENAGTDFNLLIVDACRNNPFYRQWKATRSVSAQEGLAKVLAPEGTAIAFSTSPGNFSDDGNGRNSPYTASLLRHIRTPGIEVGIALRRVRADVRDATNEQQSPWLEMSFSGEFFFVPEEEETELLIESETEEPTEDPVASSPPEDSQPKVRYVEPSDEEFFTTPPAPAPALPDRVLVLPSIQSERVNFPRGADRILLANEVTPDEVRRYVVNAREGQIMTARITDAQGPAGFDVLMPGGEIMADASGIVFWESYLATSGDYYIDISAERTAKFTIEIAVSEAIPTE